MSNNIRMFVRSGRSCYRHHRRHCRLFHHPSPLVSQLSSPRQEVRLLQRERVAWFSSSGGRDGNNKNDFDDDDNDNVHSEWIPPSRPLIGDQGHHGVSNQKVQDAKEAFDEAEAALFRISDDDTEEDILRKLEEALALEEALEEQQLQEQIEREKQLQSQIQKEGDDGGVVDWMETRRAALGKSSDEASDVIPVLHHTLLTSEEMQALLESVGGTNVTVILDEEDQPRMGGYKGMMFCTAPTPFFLQTMTRALVDHLKERKLHEKGVSGAQIGNNAMSSMQRLQSYGNHDSIQWNAIDCKNYLVHIMDEATRQNLKLEDLWSGKDPIWQLNLFDDDEVETYIANHPVPRSYGPNPTNSKLVGDSPWLLNNPHSSKQLQRQAFVAPHRPVIPTAVKQRTSRAAKRRRRQQKQQKSRNSLY